MLNQAMTDDKSGRDALARWLEEHGDFLYRFAFFQLHDAPAAEDLVQDTLIAAWSARAKYAGEASERTWLTAILKNKIVDHFRRVRRESPGEMSLDEGFSDEDLDGLFNANAHWRLRPANPGEPARALEDKQFWRALNDCLADLPAAQAQAFMLAELHEMPTAEMCKVLQLSTSNVWVVLHRARMRLRLCLEARWLRGHNRPDTAGE